VLFITCDSGFVNPGSYLLTFGDAGRLTEALARVEAKPRRGRLCVLDAQMFTPALGADHMFAEVCRQLGGNVLAGSARGGAPAEARAG